MDTIRLSISTFCSNGMAFMKIGDKMKVIKTVTTIDGTLYEGETVKFQEAVHSNGDYRVKDSMGRIWFIKKENLK